MRKLNIKTAGIRVVSLVKKIKLPVFVVEIIFATLISLPLIPALTLVKKAEAAPGNLAVFRDSTNDTTIADSPSSTHITWSSSDDVDSIYSLQGNNYDIQLGESGHYLVLYSVHTEDDGGSNRSDSIGWIELDGTDSAYGYSSGYIRRTGGNFEGYNQGAGIIYADSGDMINIEMQKRDSNSGTVARQRVDKSGINLLKLKDNWNYIRLYRNTNSSNVHGWTSFTDVDWQIADEEDSTSFSWDVGTADEITLKGFAGDHFLVTANISLYQSASSNNRQNYEMRLALDGTGVDGTTTSGYIRGNHNSNGTYSAVTSYVGIITKQSNNDETLTVQLRRESTASATTYMVANETAVSIVRIPNLADYIRMVDYDGSQDLSTTRTAITWDTTLEEDASFSHNTTFTSRIDLNGSGDFLVLSSAHNERPTNGDVREAPFLEYRVDGSTLLKYGGHGSYNRGYQSNYAMSSGSSGGAIINNLSTGQYIELTQINEAANDDSLYTAGGLGFQVVRIDTLFLPPVPFTTQKHFRWRDDTVALDGTAGWLDAEDGNDSVGDIERNENVRLRIEVANAGNDVEDAARAYELQWGEKNGSCAGVSSWTGVGDSSDEFEMYNTSNYTDGDSTSTGVLTNAEGYTFTNGEGKDTGDTTSNIGPMNDNYYTELEYSIRPTSSASFGTTYCFRLYDTNNNEELDDYPVYPELTIGTPYTEQLHYRWRGDTVGLDSTGGWLAVEDSNPSTPTKIQENSRLRVEVANTGTHDETSNRTYELQWGLKSTTCSAISSWTGVADSSDDFDMVNSTYIQPDGTAATTSVLANSEGYTFTNGEGRDVADTTGSLGPLGDESYTEIEYSFEPTVNATTGATYCFRLYDTTAGETLDNYSVYPEMTIVNPHTTQMHFRWRDDSEDLNPTIPTTTLGEVGQVTTDYAGTNVQFSAEYTNPVVIAESISGDDTGGSTNRPAAAMITYVDGTGFNVRIQETDSEDDDHGNETFGWMVMEEGSWELSDGTQVDAGVETLTTSEYWNGGSAHDCNFNQSFSSAPAVFSALQTNNNTGTVDFLNSYLDTVTTSDFDCYIGIEDGGSGTPTSGEDFGWIAIELGTGTASDIDYEAGDTGTNLNGWSDTPWHNQSFTQSFSSAPVLITSRNEGNGADEGWIRYDDLTSSSVDLAIDENDDSSDRSHTTTDGAYYVAWETTGDLSIELDGSAGWITEEDSNPSNTINRDDTYRLRIEVANSGDYIESAARSYELQWGEKTSTCSAISSWVGVDDTDDAFDMVASTHIDPDGETTTTGLLSNAEEYTRVNGEGRDVLDTTDTIGPLDASEYTELEYSIKATDKAVTGSTYCFRLYDTNNSEELDSYQVYPELQLDYELLDTEGLMMEWDTQSGVTDDGWTDISFNGSYTNPVFVCTPEYANNQGNETDSDNDSIVCRVQNVTSTGAQIRLQEPGAPGDLSDAETVHWMVVEDGSYDTTDIKLEAFTYTSTVTDSDSSWVGQSQTLSQTYTNPVTVGSVTSYNDPKYTAFWSHDGSRGAATSTNFYAGKHVAEDPDTSRSDETISVIVIEEANDTLNGTDYEAQLQGQSIERIDDAHTNYSFNQAFSSAPEVAIASITGMSGGNGGHIILYDEGSGVTSSTNIYLVTVEEEIGDGEQNGSAEYGPYIAFETAGSSFIALDQTNYQWFDNNNGVQPGTQQANENTATTDVEVNEVIRLRMSVQSGLGDLKANDKSFKLQYGQGSDCSAIGSWVDVDGTGGSGIWRGYDNGGASDGADITSSLLNNNNNTLQSYEEGNNSVTNPNAISEGDRGEWDWVIQNNGATALTNYCFRMVTSDGDTLNYSKYPQLTTSPVAYTQNDFEWYETTNSVTLTNVWPPGDGADLNENEALTQLPASNETLINGDQIRIQMNFTTSKSNLDVSTQNFRLEYAAANDCTAVGSWTQIGAKGSGSIWRLFDETAIGNSTSQVNQISTSDSGSEGYYSEISPSAVNPAAVNVGESSEWDWPVENNGAAENTTYCFRMTLGDGTEFDTYNADSYPKLTTAPGISNQLRHGKFYKDEEEKGFFWVD